MLPVSSTSLHLTKSAVIITVHDGSICLENVYSTTGMHKTLINKRRRRKNWFENLRLPPSFSLTLTNLHTFCVRNRISIDSTIIIWCGWWNFGMPDGGAKSLKLDPIWTGISSFSMVVTRSTVLKFSRGCFDFNQTNLSIHDLFTHRGEMHWNSLVIPVSRFFKYFVLKSFCSTRSTAMPVVPIHFYFYLTHFQFSPLLSFQLFYSSCVSISTHSS